MREVYAHSFADLFYKFKLNKSNDTREFTAGSLEAVCW